MSVPVAVAEVLEVRGSPLCEADLWCLLDQSCRPLKELLASAKSSSVGDCSVSAETVFLHGDGRLEMKMVHKSGLLPPFLPPEYVDSADEGDDSDHFAQRRPSSEDPEGMEKACIHSLGAILAFGRDYSSQASASSAQLLSLLNLLCVKDPATRPSLAKLAQVRLLLAVCRPFRSVCPGNGSIRAPDKVRHPPGPS
jgi:hypothetical protein